jgi:hypothetical protein
MQSTVLYFITPIVLLWHVTWVVCFRIESITNSPVNITRSLKEFLFTTKYLQIFLLRLG